MRRLGLGTVVGNSRAAPPVPLGPRRFGDPGRRWWPRPASTRNAPHACPADLVPQRGSIRATGPAPRGGRARRRRSVAPPRPSRTAPPGEALRRRRRTRSTGCRGRPRDRTASARTAPRRRPSRVARRGSPPVANVPNALPGPDNSVLGPSRARRPARSPARRAADEYPAVALVARHVPRACDACR